MADQEKTAQAKAQAKAKPNPPSEQPNELTALAPDFEGRVSNRPVPREPS